MSWLLAHSHGDYTLLFATAVAAIVLALAVDLIVAAVRPDR